MGRTRKENMMAKYLLLKHYRGGPAPAVDWAPMDQWTPDEVEQPHGDRSDREQDTHLRPTFPAEVRSIFQRDGSVQGSGIPIQGRIPPLRFAINEENVRDTQNVSAAMSNPGEGDAPRRALP